MDVTFQQALAGIVSLIVTAVIAIGQTKKAVREAEAHRQKEWADIMALQKQHIDTLEARVEDQQTELIRAHEKIARIQVQSETWSARNARLYEQVQELRSRLNRGGLDAGPEPNGSG